MKGDITPVVGAALWLVLSPTTNHYQLIKPQRAQDCKLCRPAYSVKQKWLVLSPTRGR